MPEKRMHTGVFRRRGPKRAMPIWGLHAGNRKLHPLLNMTALRLSRFCRYFWTAEVISDTGRSSVSGPASFCNGRFPALAGAVHGPEQFSYARNRALYCRADFTLKRSRNAPMRWFAAGLSVLSINGIRQGDAVLEPGFTAF